MKKSEEYGVLSPSQVGLTYLVKIAWEVQVNFKDSELYTDRLAQKKGFNFNSLAFTGQ